MSQFPTLEEFLLLLDVTDIHGRSIHKDEFMAVYDRGRKPDRLAIDYVNRYRLAKQNWLCYRDEGPPQGTICRMIGTGQICVMGGISKQDSRCFELLEEHQRYKMIVPRAHWWAIIEGLT